MERAHIGLGLYLLVFVCLHGGAAGWNGATAVHIQQNNTSSPLIHLNNCNAEDVNRECAQRGALTEPHSLECDTIARISDVTYARTLNIPTAFPAPRGDGAPIL